MTETHMSADTCTDTLRPRQLFGCHAERFFRLRVMWIDGFQYTALHDIGFSSSQLKTALTSFYSKFDITIRRLVLLVLKSQLCQRTGGSTYNIGCFSLSACGCSHGRSDLLYRARQPDQYFLQVYMGVFYLSQR